MCSIDSAAEGRSEALTWCLLPGALEACAGFGLPCLLFVGPCLVGAAVASGLQGAAGPSSGVLCFAANPDEWGTCSLGCGITAGVLSHGMWLASSRPAEHSRYCLG